MRKRFLYDEDEHGSPIAVIEQTDQNTRDMRRRKIVTPKTMKRKKSFTRHNVEYTINDDCLSTIPIREWIANGKYGSVFLACVEHECKYILKMIPLNVHIPTEECDISQPDNLDTICIKYSENDFMHETNLSIKFGQSNIGPKVKMIGFCEDVENKYQGKIKVGYMVQEKYDMTLKEYISKYPNDFNNGFGFISNELIRKAKQIDEMGYFNEDIHEENIMLKIVDDVIKDVALIDFGLVGNYLQDDIERDKTEIDMKEFLVQLRMDVQNKHGKLRKNMQTDQENESDDSSDHNTKRTLFGDDESTKRSLLFGDEDEEINVTKNNTNTKRSLFGDNEKDIDEGKEDGKEGDKKRKQTIDEGDNYHGEPVSWYRKDPTRGFFPRHPEDDVLLKRKHEKEEKERDLRKKKKKNKQKDKTQSNIGSLYEQMEQMKIDEENPNPQFGYRQVFYG